MTQPVLEPSKAPVVAAAAAAGGTGGDMLDRDPRVEALMRMVASREDNNIVGSRFSTLKAQGPKGTMSKQPTRQSLATMTPGSHVRSLPPSL